MKTQIVVYFISGDAVLSLSVHDLASFALRAWNEFLFCTQTCHNNVTCHSRFTALESPSRSISPAAGWGKAWPGAERQERREEQPREAGRDKPLPHPHQDIREDRSEGGLEESWVEGVFLCF